METAKIMLLLQLITKLESSFNSFEKSYNHSDKESFEKEKSRILEINKKIDFLIRKNVHRAS